MIANIIVGNLMHGVITALCVNFLFPGFLPTWWHVAAWAQLWLSVEVLLADRPTK